MSPGISESYRFYRLYMELIHDISTIDFQPNEYNLRARLISLACMDYIAMRTLASECLHSPSYDNICDICTSVREKIRQLAIKHITSEDMAVLGIDIDSL